MPQEPRLPKAVAMALQAIEHGHIYGYSVMEATRLPSGTVYPALRRLEMDGLIASRWEKQSAARSGQRPPRKYYRITRSGKLSLNASRSEYPQPGGIVPAAHEKV
jgi:PadR family transcriptional regulator, regulatory protein PadR